MARKKWTPKEEITDELLRFRKKRRWQMAFRRYVVEKNISEDYAVFFGLDIQTYREWIENQFDDTMHWGNFGVAWQFEHLVPVTFFDFNKEEDLRLCWSYLNIRLQRIDKHPEQEKSLNLLEVKSYFETLRDSTGDAICSNMCLKLEQLSRLDSLSVEKTRSFMEEKKEKCLQLASLSSDSLVRLNKGASLETLLMEQEILRKFG